LRRVFVRSPATPAFIRCREFLSEVAPRRLRAMTPILAWATISIGLGFILGLASVALPPAGALGIVAVAALLLLWALPEFRSPPSIWVRRLFYAMIVVDLCIPFYYTIELESLPWISMRRIVTFPLIVVSALAIAGSGKVRTKLAEAAGASRTIVCGAIAFYASIVLSLPFSINPSGSVAQFSDATLIWFIPLLTVIQVINGERDVERLVRVLCVCAVFVTALGIIEFRLQHRFLVDIVPGWLLDKDYLADADLSSFRNGMYRASSVYTVSLSFGEYEAMMAPFGLYYFFHGGCWRDKAFGVVTFVTACAGIFVSGARGAYMAVLLATAVFVALYSVRTARFEPRSLTPAVVALASIVVFAVVIALVIFWQRAHNLVLGDGMSAYSDQARYDQWELAKPQIVKSPLFGQGFAQGAHIVGYHTPGGFPTIDSYVISLLVETGLFGFLSFAAILLMSIWTSAQLYLSKNVALSALMGAFTCSFVGFGFYRLALSQRENHTAFFVMVGIVAVANKLIREHGAAPQSSSGRTNVGGYGTNRAAIQPRRILL